MRINKQDTINASLKCIDQYKRAIEILKPSCAKHHYDRKLNKKLLRMTYQAIKEEHQFIAKLEAE